MHSISIMRSGAILATIKQDDNSVQAKRIMSENQLNVAFEDNRYINFDIGDYCTVFGEIYKLNNVPVVQKGSVYFWSYTLILESEASDLKKAVFLFLGDDNTLKEPDFSLMENASGFVDLILENMSRVSPGWTKGEVIPTEHRPLTFSKENCYDALSQISEAFETEFWVKDKVISLTKIQNDTGRLFRQGRHKGLYTVTRQNLEGFYLATRLYIYGSEKNLPVNYRNFSQRLLLPIVHPGTVANVSFTFTPQGGILNLVQVTYSPPTATDVTNITMAFRETGTTGVWYYKTVPVGDTISTNIPLGFWDFQFITKGGVYDGYATSIISLDSSGGPFFIEAPIFLERNVDKYGVMEAVEIFEDVYPHRTGKVTGVDATDEFKFTDTTIDFDLNSYLLPGVAAKVTFNTGQLGGYVFDISSYDHSTKTVIILLNKDEKALEVPSALLRPAIGDTYVFTDISMPQTYIDAAEDELKTKAEELLIKRSTPQVKYLIDTDPTYLRRINFIPQIGDLIWIKDNELNVEKRIRVVNTIRKITNEYEILVEISEEVEERKPIRIERQTTTNQRNILGLQRFVANRDVLNNRFILPVYADDAAAGAAGLTTGMPYRTDTGLIKVKL